MSSQPERRSSLALLLDLVHQVEAEKLPAEVRPAGISASDIVRILEQRTEQSFSGNAQSCIKWFLTSSSPLSNDERSRLIRMEELRDGKRDFNEAFEEMLSEMKNSGD